MGGDNSIKTSNEGVRSGRGILKTLHFFLKIHQPLSAPLSSQKAGGSGSAVCPNLSGW